MTTQTPNELEPILKEVEDFILNLMVTNPMLRSNESYKKVVVEKTKECLTNYEHLANVISMIMEERGIE
jgi:hypothetical protein